MLLPSQKQLTVDGHTRSRLSATQLHTSLHVFRGIVHLSSLSSGSSSSCLNKAAISIMNVKVTAQIDPSTGFFYAPHSLLAIPNDVKGGIVAMGVLGLFSFLTTLSLFVFITYRMVYWRKYYDAPISSHQFIVLIFNLLIADLQQALSFLFSFHWLHQGTIMAPSPACFAQGWLIQIGDLSSGIWVLAIGFHTFYGLVSKTVIPYRVFVSIVIGIWVFCLILTLIGPATHPNDFFTNTGVWVC